MAQNIGNIDPDKLAEYREAFDLFDEDGSGEIDVEEFENLMKTLGYNYTDIELKEMIEQIDIDGSGEIDFAEFITLMSNL